MKTLDELIVSRPVTLTYSRAETFLHQLEISPEWLEARSRGEIPDGLAGMRGMLTEHPPANMPTSEEAEWILGLSECTSMRGVAGIVLGDDNQISGDSLIRTARLVKKSTSTDE